MVDHGAVSRLVERPQFAWFYRDSVGVGSSSCLVGFEQRSALSERWKHRTVGFLTLLLAPVVVRFLNSVEKVVVLHVGYFQHEAFRRSPKIFLRRVLALQEQLSFPFDFPDVAVCYYFVNGPLAMAEVDQMSTRQVY